MFAIKVNSAWRKKMFMDRGADFPWKSHDHKPAQAIGGSRGMLPQEKFGFLSAL